MKRVLLIALTLIAMATQDGHAQEAQPVGPEGDTSLGFLKSLEGKWVVQSEQDRSAGWEFMVTSRGSTVIERLLVGTPKEMATLYYLDNGALVGTHYCQMKNQPHMKALKMVKNEELVFVCSGDVSNTRSHDEKHMHGVRLRKSPQDGLQISMDILENGKVVAQPVFDLVRKN